MLTNVWSKDDIFEMFEKKEEGKSFKDIPFLGKNFMHDITNRHCIYFLYNSDIGNVVYVGQTKSLLNRLSQHSTQNVKKFNGFMWIFVEKDEVDFIEWLFIYMFKPKYNMSHNSEMFDSVVRYHENGQMPNKNFLKQDMDRVLHMNVSELYNTLTEAKC